MTVRAARWFVVVAAVLGAGFALSCTATPTTAEIQVAMQNLTAEPVEMWLGHAEEAPPSSGVAPSEFRFATASVRVSIEKWSGDVERAYGAEGASAPTLGQCVQVPELSSYCRFDDKLRVNVSQGGSVREFELDLQQDPNRYSPTIYVDWDGATVRVRGGQ